MIRWWDLLPSPGFCGNFLGPYLRTVESCVKVLDKLFTDWSLLPLWDLMFVKDDFCLYNHAEMGKIFGKLLRCCLQKKKILFWQIRMRPRVLSLLKKNNKTIFYSMMSFEKSLSLKSVCSHPTLCRPLFAPAMLHSQEHFRMQRIIRARQYWRAFWCIITIYSIYIYIMAYRRRLRWQKISPATRFILHW